MMKEKILLLALLFPLLFASCEKDDEDTGNRLLPVKLTCVGEFSRSSVYTLTYDDQNRIIGVDYDTYQRTIDYNELGQIVEEQVFPKENALTLKSTATFNYEKELVRIEQKFDNGPLLSQNGFIQLDRAGRAVYSEYETESDPSYGTPMGTMHYRKYKYDKRGNVSKIEFLDLDVMGDFEYQWDNRKGIFKEVNMPQWYMDRTDIAFYFTVNNRQSTDGIFYQYEFNEDGYPTKCTFWTRVGESSITIEYVPANDVK